MITLQKNKFDFPPFFPPSPDVAVAVPAPAKASGRAKHAPQKFSFTTLSLYGSLSSIFNSSYIYLLIYLFEKGVNRTSYGNSLRIESKLGFEDDYECVMEL
jgi:hypothetical protein